MPLAPSFDQYKFDIDTEGDLGERLYRILRNCWPSKTRESVESIQPTNKWVGNVYQIKFNEENKPPKIGGYVESLARYGWGYLHYDQSYLYLAPIKRFESQFGFEGRENMEFQLPPIRRVPDIEINHDMPLNNEPRDRDERRIQQLRNDILEVWPTKTLESIKSMTYGTSESNTYIINTESEDEIETDENGDLKVIHREIPDSPLGKHVDALLRKGWAVATVKGNSLFVSRLRRTDPPKNSELKPANAYKFESSENLMYVPEVCEFCESHESYELVVVDTEKSKFTETENPVFERACKQCIEDHSYPTSQEYYDK